MTSFSCDRLLIFARYPEPGKAKTRLIPALGAEGAAALYREMAEHTVRQAIALRQKYPVSIEVWFTGGSAEQMRSWLGNSLHYCEQAKGDLGDRLTAAVEAGFTTGVERLVIIGTDCPELDTALLEQAFQQLQQADVVLGPATDGGYYLIGLRQPLTQLFQGIAWSTEGVFQQTVAIAQSLNASLSYLPKLSDVDYPDDLEIWERVKRAESNAAPATQLVKEPGF